MTPGVGALVAQRYSIGPELGRGGQGVVFSALDQATGQTVAVKMVDLPRDPEERALTLSELQAEVGVLVAVRSPHCLQVLDVVLGDGWVALVTDLVPGVTMRELLNAYGAATPVQALEVMYGALSGLAAVHRAGLLHGDVKPANILVDPAGSSRIIDFGLAGVFRVLRSGTPAYMSPEQASGRALADGRSDVYSCGVVLFELLTGVKPFSGDTATVIQAHVSTPVPDPRTLMAGIPDDVASLVGWSMAKDPAQRPVNAQDFLERLDTAARGAYGVNWRGAATTGALTGLGGVVGAMLAAGGGGVSGAIGGAGAAAAHAVAVGAGVSGTAAAGSGVAGAAASGSVATTAATSAATVGGTLTTAKIAVASVVAVAAVGGGGAVVVAQNRDNEPATPAGARPTPTPTTQKPRELDRSIETFDLSNTQLNVSRWMGSTSPTLTLQGGRVTDFDEGEPSMEYTLGDYRGFAPADVVYGDFDGDLYQDLAVQLTAVTVGGNGSFSSWFIWRWDPVTGTAVQVEQPIAQDARCGDHVERVTAVGNELMVEERLRLPGDFDTQSCADTATHRNVRRVRLEDAWPVNVAPVKSAGSMCVEPYDQATGGWMPIPAGGLKVAPHEEASEVDLSRAEEMSLLDPVGDGDRWSYAVIRMTPAGDLSESYNNVYVCGWVSSNEVS